MKDPGPAGQASPPSPAESALPAKAESRPGAPPIEVGWVLAGGLSALQRRAIDAARERVERSLAARFPAFRWSLPVVEGLGADARAAGDGGGLDEPAARLHEGVAWRDTLAWDFAFVVTPRDLESHYKSYALAVPSRALGVAVISLARLSPGPGPASDEDASELLARRVGALALHLFGDLNGLWHRDDPASPMFAPEAVDDLDDPRSFLDDEARWLAATLADVADLRLEETSAPPRGLRFYLRASPGLAGEIASAVLQARPWELPFRLSRLSAAALSALFVLLVTAEVWDLGTSQDAPTIGALSLLVLVGTTAFVLARQKLILRRGRSHESEQTVVMNVSAVLIVLLGLLTTYALLFALTVLLGATLFGPALVARWAPAVDPSAPALPLLAMAGLVSSLGLLIGSLGASFEGHHYFRHVIYADEET